MIQKSKLPNRSGTSQTHTKDTMLMRLAKLRADRLICDIVVGGPDNVRVRTSSAYNKRRIASRTAKKAASSRTIKPGALVTVIGTRNKRKLGTRARYWPDPDDKTMCFLRKPSADPKTTSAWKVNCNYVRPYSSTK